MAARQYFLTVAAAILAAFTIRQTLLTAYKVPTGSMQPALKPGDFIFSSRIAYGLKIPGTHQILFAGEPKRGDVVVFSYPNQPNVNYVKRVVALAGDKVQIVGHKLVLNGVPMHYEETPNVGDDNPNPELFDMFVEGDGKNQWRVVLERGEETKNFGPLTVPPGEIFLLGDNRDTSDDSRYWGTVPVSQIRGQAVLIWLSLDWKNPEWVDQRFPHVRWGRLLSTVH